MEKTVYILGAGFSISAGAPSQEKIIEKIFKLYDSEPYIFDEGKVEQFKKFLLETLSIPETLQKRVPLEDLFTPLDRCIIDNLSLGDLDINGVRNIREVIYYLIGKTLQHILVSNDKAYIDKFARYLVNQCSQRKNRNYKNVDSVSVLTSNWDILLDNSVQSEIDRKNDEAVVDYCCYISSYTEDDNRVRPGLEMLGLGGYNVKIVKLHGSFNWLQCPKCQRVYVDPDYKIAIDQYHQHITCRHCDKNYGRTNSHELTSNIIMPTFLKNLSNPQYKLIWQNAGVELSEASKIVFIGYSLPQADFEMRQLLARMIRPNAKIEVVGYSSDPINDIEFQKLKERYELFFGDRLNLPIYHGGAKQYIEGEF